MRSPIDLTIRSFKSAAANWQLVVIRMAESAVFIFLTILALLATIIPVAVKAGLGVLKPGVKDLNMEDAESFMQNLTRFIDDQRALILWTCCVLIGVACVMMIVHTLIVAGSARVYLDAERAPGNAFEVFRGDTFWAAAKGGFWRVFWIYNIAWAFALLLLAVPVMLALILILVMEGSQGAVILAVLVFVFCLMLSIPIGIITSVWVGRAIIDGERSQLPAREALGVARRSIRTDLGAHVVVVLLVMVVSLFVMFFISAMTNAFAASGDAFWPMQWMSSLAQAVAGSLAGAWMLAGFAALAENSG